MYKTPIYGDRRRRWTDGRMIRMTQKDDGEDDIVFAILVGEKSTGQNVQTSWGQNIKKMKCADTGLPICQWSTI